MSERRSLVLYSGAGLRTRTGRRRPADKLRTRPRFVMVFTKRLREGVRRGRIRCTIRIWKRLHVKVGGRYPMDEGHVVVDSIDTIDMTDITDDLARESGFDSA